jgi:hypothetical protein
MIKADGNLWMLIDRPIAMGLASVTLLIWGGSIIFGLVRFLKKND